MNFQVLKNAGVLARKLHFTLAAEELHIVQPALSRQIKQLEEEVGAKLFERNKRKVELTAAGRYFFGELKQLLRNWDSIKLQSRKIQDGRAGELIIGFTHSIMQSLLPDILRRIRKEVPQMKVILREMSNYDQNQALLNREIDLSFATHPLVPPNVNSKVLRRDYFALLLPSNHPVTLENFTGVADFVDEEFIFPSRSDGENYVSLIESICLDAGFAPKVNHFTDSATSSFRLVEAGMGISLEPISSLHNQSPSIRSIILENIPQRADLTMMWREDFEANYSYLYQILVESGSEPMSGAS
ncbi:MAG: LysR substrate-binding domain-containing protein [Bacteroidia bacterium]|nr:LysR substrate-binding domain-containing protein [Bacteroidia bacterium]